MRQLSTIYLVTFWQMCIFHATVGGVAQWLGRQSLAGELSLIYAWSMDDIVTTLWVVSAMGQPTRPPPGSVNK